MRGNRSGAPTCTPNTGLDLTSAALDVKFGVPAHTWGEDELRWELRPHEDGCVLVLTHTFDDRFKAARDAAAKGLAPRLALEPEG